MVAGFRNIFYTLCVYFSFFNFYTIHAQCAGTGAQIDICNKESDSSLQMFNLFDVLINETPGGTWVAASNFDSQALDETTGLLNLWEINRFGSHTFTYMNPECDASTATVIINLGGYPGESNQNPGTNNVCQILKVDDDDNVNIIDLFIFIDTINNMIGPDVGGVWTEDAGNMALGLINNEFFNFGGVPIGVYTFTYTTPNFNGCPARSATIDVEVRRSPNPGNPLNLYLCETDDLSGLTELNLFSRLEGEDTNGEWTDVNEIPTGEISSGTDFVIDVQNIYNNFGSGSYEFTYRVLPSHPICEEQQTTFVLCIEKQLILDGSANVACDGNVTLIYDNKLLNNGAYSLSYSITGASLGTFSETKAVSFQNGTAQFNVFPQLILSTSETLTITIDNIVAAPVCGPKVLCTSIVNVPPANFDSYIDPSITISSTSGCELDDILITYINAVSPDFSPTNGTVSVSYSINTVNFTDEVTFSNGNATATVPVSRFNQGLNTLVFFETNSFVHCNAINAITTLNLIPAPPNPVFTISPDDRCDAKTLQFGFDSPSGELISYNSVTFDIYQFGSEPQQFDPRDPSVSLTNNTQGNGIDINLINSNDVSTLPDGDYVFIIRSVQNDNAPCRGLSQTEISNYKAQGIDIGLTQIGNTHIFDARLIFRIGDPDPVTLVKNSFEVCLLNSEVTLNDLSISAGTNVNIALTNLSGAVLPNTYQITQDQEFIVVFTSALTGCDLGTEKIAVTVVTTASSPVLSPNVFCSIVTNNVADLLVSNQDIVWYDSEIGGRPYSALEAIDANKAYWAEITITGGCVSANRTQAVIDFVDKASEPIPLVNEFCLAATPTISDLMVESDASATLEWFTSQSGPAYTSTSLPLNNTNQYWVSQTIAPGCQSDRVQVTFTITDVAPNPVPLDNNFCTANGTALTLNDLMYNDTSIIREGVLSYFSDLAATVAIPSTELLENLTSPVYVQQVVAGVCVSDVVQVDFTSQGVASKPTLSAVTLCLDSNPVIQDLIDALQSQIGTEITIYENELIPTAIDVNLDLASLTTTLYATQTIIDGCESLEREAVVFTLEAPSISSIDFRQVYCSIDNVTLNDVYLGRQNILWFDVNSNPLLGTELVQDGVSYFAQLEVNTCLSATLEVGITVIDVQDPVSNIANADFCGIEDKILSDLLEDDAGNTRFIPPLNHTLVWYDSNDVSTRNMLDSDTVLESRVYYAVYEVNTTIAGQSFMCESNSLPVAVDLTVCDPKELIIPDAFSPNGDTINDTFELKNIQFIYPDYTIEIFNRYGRLVFKGDTAIGFWDGKSNQSGTLGNEVLPTSVYFYVINFNRFDRKPYQGQVYLKR